VRVFLSWSGESSRKLAEALRDWLPSVLQLVEPYMSAEDTAKGARWPQEVARQLEESEFGIICVTRDNQRSEWLNFEAGALSKSVLNGRVVPLLLGVDEIDPRHPLWQFQSARCEHADVLRLVRDINKAGERALTGEQLERGFGKWWPDLEAKLADISLGQAAEPAALERGPEAGGAERQAITAQPEPWAAGAQRATAQRAAADDIGADLLREFKVAFTAFIAVFTAFVADLSSDRPAGFPGADEVYAQADALKEVYDKAMALQSPRHAMRARVLKEQRRLDPGAPSAPSRLAGTTTRRAANADAPASLITQRSHS
jgi:hypothetical protein